MNLLVFGRSTDCDEVIRLVRLLEGEFEIEVYAVDAYNSILTLTPKQETPP
jgi:hypothetical protein